MSKVQSAGISRPSAIVAGSLSESERIQSTGKSAAMTITIMPTLQNAYSRVPRLIAYASFSRPGIVVPKPRTKRKAMISTRTKISTETADPSPRLTLEMSWL